MSARQQKNWIFWREHICRLGESLSQTHGGSALPVPLKRIAESRMVRNVVFRPLLVDGCLTITDAGFNIYVRCEKGRSQEATAKFEAEDQAGPLPTRMRFTIAHEIAHTFFFDLTRGRPRNRLAANHPNTVGALERACGQAAARILLPSDVVLAEFRTRDVYEPSALRRFAEKAAVSPQMLVNRIGELGGSLHGIGGFGYAEMGEAGYRLKAVRMHAALREIFPRAATGSPVSDLVPDTGFVLNGGTAFEQTVAVQCRTNLSKFTQRFRVVCEDCEGQEHKRGVFLTLQRIEQAAV